MIRIVLVGGLLFGSLVFLGGCSADGTAVEPLPTEPSSNESGTKSPSKSSQNEDNGHYTLPATPTAPADPAAPASPDPTKDPSAPVDPGGQQPAGAVQTSSCTATNGANKSVTTFEYSLDNNGTLKISKMTVAMTNKDNRNKNDVDVFVTPPNGSETKSFNSGDILPNAKTTEVPLPTNFGPKTGAKVRIETNFDEAFIDPSASCIIQF